MPQQDTKSRFTTRLLRPENPGDGKPWAFVILPLDASARLPRRGRITVDGTINGLEFRTLLEPDGQKSHWLRLEQDLLEASGAAIGEVAQFEIMPAAQEPDPEVPTDFLEALQASPEARVTWDQTTTVARVDWIHWVTSAKQTRTRSKRINDACDKLAQGKKRVCCFDPSGYYSKAFCAPQPQEDPL